MDLFHLKAYDYFYNFFQLYFDYLYLKLSCLHMNLKLIIDDKKINNILKTTSFEYLQDLEREFGFSESVNANNKKRVTFFKFGNKNDGKNSLPLDIKKELENSLQEEMKELGYL